MESLFAESGFPGSLYWHLKRREVEVGCGARERIDAMWRRYAHHADDHFVSEFTLHTHQRYWEMYLTLTLEDREFTFSSRSSGPDVCVSTSTGSIWVEAVAPTQGDAASDDRVPDLWFGEAAELYPEDARILRYAAAVASKQRCHVKWVGDGRVGRDDPFVIAVSGGGLPLVFDDVPAPEIVKAVLPVGNEQHHIDLATGACVRVDYEHRAEILKATGSPVATGVFLDPEFANVSAILYSASDVLNPPASPGGEFLLVHNPLASNPLARGWLGFGREYTPGVLDGLLRVSLTAQY